MKKLSMKNVKSVDVGQCLRGRIVYLKTDAYIYSVSVSSIIANRNISDDGGIAYLKDVSDESSEYVFELKHHEIYDLIKQMSDFIKNNFDVNDYNACPDCGQVIQACKCFPINPNNLTVPLIEIYAGVVTAHINAANLKNIEDVRCSINSVAERVRNINNPILFAKLNVNSRDDKRCFTEVYHTDLTENDGECHYVGGGVDPFVFLPDNEVLMKIQIINSEAGFKSALLIPTEDAKAKHASVYIDESGDTLSTILLTGNGYEEGYFIHPCELATIEEYDFASSTVLQKD